MLLANMLIQTKEHRCEDQAASNFQYCPWWDDKHDSFYEHDRHYGSVFDKCSHTNNLPFVLRLQNQHKDDGHRTKEYQGLKRWLTGQDTRKNHVQEDSPMDQDQVRNPEKNKMADAATPNEKTTRIEETVEIREDHGKQRYTMTEVIARVDTRHDRPSETK
ncbi:hypothetical protein E3N88_13850 [Mikania micrantha]|uniref:Uncharacterized protein n=1 Tax=Mikania micrantha TaxID=192012 RepID=A0A5N6NZP1_9ASTR|nr:hypothetical protein E3N88_13850 [Mikania micrantha]